MKQGFAQTIPPWLYILTSTEMILSTQCNQDNYNTVYVRNSECQY